MLTAINFFLWSLIGLMCAYKQQNRPTESISKTPWIFLSIISMSVAIAQSVDTVLTPTFQLFSNYLTGELHLSQALSELILLTGFTVICSVYCYLLPVRVSAWASKRGFAQYSDCATI
ncbi:TPA: hypothetical protein ACVU4L_004151 [Vibrio parahaemolyticus]|uniref:Uncharacterized protein n=2 Tax=Vibrio TaxID=662 RepID=A0A1B1LRF3_VIBPH|nr:MULTISPECIES: hypothetical protein [Vibrio]ANS55633.1 hypothetical protein [Vibrio parahaemolyticus]MBL4244934.1 hypothetical protein [Vibrio fluvialis]MBL4253820.1 hypothetical protein [Vibrio fluvialis]MCI9701154.1 hypothetical protein [Vibrio parahaemolyticus]MCR9814136.1 hypothetical protein [Vibrio parahaemolyticus]